MRKMFLNIYISIICDFWIFALTCLKVKLTRSDRTNALFMGNPSGCHTESRCFPISLERVNSKNWRRNCSRLHCHTVCHTVFVDCICKLTIFACWQRDTQWWKSITLSHLEQVLCLASQFQKLQQTALSWVLYLMTVYLCWLYLFVDWYIEIPN